MIHLQYQYRSPLPTTGLCTAQPVQMADASYKCLAVCFAFSVMSCMCPRIDTGISVSPAGENRGVDCKDTDGNPSLGLCFICAPLCYKIGLFGKLYFRGV